MPSRLFFFNDTAPTEIYTLSLHDALPISTAPHHASCAPSAAGRSRCPRAPAVDRKSTRLNSSHDQISYAVFCLKKKKHLRTVAVPLVDVMSSRLAVDLSRHLCSNTDSSST